MGMKKSAHIPMVNPLEALVLWSWLTHLSAPGLLTNLKRALDSYVLLEDGRAFHTASCWDKT